MHSNGIRISSLLLLIAAAGLTGLTGCGVGRLTTARAMKGVVVDLRGKPVAGAEVLIQTRGFPSARESRETRITTTTDGRFHYPGQSSWTFWSAFIIADAWEGPATVTASHQELTSTLQHAGGGMAPMRWFFGIGKTPTVDLGNITLAPVQ